MVREQTRCEVCPGVQPKAKDEAETGTPQGKSRSLQGSCLYPVPPPPLFPACGPRAVTRSPSGQPGPGPSAPWHRLPLLPCPQSSQDARNHQTITSSKMKDPRGLEKSGQAHPSAGLHGANLLCRSSWTAWRRRSSSSRRQRSSCLPDMALVAP